LTRSHHLHRRRFTSRTTRSQSRDHGVTFFKTCTAEVFRPVPIGKSPGFENPGFQIETRKDSAVHVSLSSSSLVKQPEVRGPHTLRRVPTPFTRRQIPNRFNSVVESLIKVRSIKGAKACLGLPGQCSAALSGRLIGRPNPACQRPLSTNRRIRCRIFFCAEVLDFSGPYAVLEPQSCDVLAISYAMNRRMPVGAAGGFYQGTDDF